MGDGSLPDDICAIFGIDADEPVTALSGGRVNATLTVGSPPRLVLQQVNGGYFDDPQAVMENLVRVVGHLEWRQRFDTPNAPRWFPQLQPTVTGRAYALDESGDVWRAYDYLPGETVEGDASDEAILSIAGMYGRFVAAMDDFGGPDLIETVPNFRSLDRIISEFDAEWSSASGTQRTAVSDARSEALELSDRLAALTDTFESSGLRRRVLHNDTKLNNVLLIPGTSHAAAVVDYDLVMHGWAMDDFGDLVRSAIQHRPAHREASGQVDVAFVGAIARAYVEGAESTLSDDEINSFSVGPARICLQLAWRYLTDLVRDEPALRVSHPMGSLGKARLNLDLAAALFGNAGAIATVVSDLAS